MKLNWNLDNVRYYIIIQNMQVMHDSFQISVSDDYQSWYQTMCAELPSRFTRLFKGPTWSGTAINEQKDPVTVSGGGLLLMMISKMISFREYQWRFDRNPTMQHNAKISSRISKMAASSGRRLAFFVFWLISTIQEGRWTNFLLFFKLKDVFIVCNS